MDQMIGYTKVKLGKFYHTYERRYVYTVEILVKIKNWLGNISEQWEMVALGYDRTGAVYHTSDLVHAQTIYDIKVGRLPEDEVLKEEAVI